VKDVNPNLFQILLFYFYSDIVDTVALDGKYREFADVVAKYGQEHYNRIVEGFLLSKQISPSLMRFLSLSLRFFSSLLINTRDTVVQCKRQWKWKNIAM